MALTIDTIRKFAIYDGKSTALHVVLVDCEGCTVSLFCI